MWVIDFVFPQHLILFNQIFKFIDLKFYIKRRNTKSSLYLQYVLCTYTCIWAADAGAFHRSRDWFSCFQPHGPALIIAFPFGVVFTLSSLSVGDFSLLGSLSYHSGPICFLAYKNLYCWGLLMDTCPSWFPVLLWTYFCISSVILEKFWEGWEANVSFQLAFWNRKSQFLPVGFSFIRVLCLIAGCTVVRA